MNGVIISPEREPTAPPTVEHPGEPEPDMHVLLSDGTPYRSGVHAFADDSGEPRIILTASEESLEKYAGALVTRSTVEDAGGITAVHRGMPGTARQAESFGEYLRQLGQWTGVLDPDGSVNRRNASLIGISSALAFTTLGATASGDMNESLEALTHTFDSVGNQGSRVTRIVPNYDGNFVYRVSETRCDASGCDGLTPNRVSGTIAPGHSFIGGDNPVNTGVWVSRSADTTLVPNGADPRALSLVSNVPGVPVGQEILMSNVEGSDALEELVSANFESGVAKYDMNGVTPYQMHAAHILYATLGVSAHDGSSLEMITDPGGQRVIVMNQSGEVALDMNYAFDHDADGNITSTMYDIQERNGVDVWVETPRGLDDVIDGAGRQILAGTGLIQWQALLDSTHSWGNAGGKCSPGLTTRCYQDGEFQVKDRWTDFAGVSGPAQTALTCNTADSGTYWFFDPTNVEMLVKVLDGRAINGHMWVFAAATTNVEYTLRVTDTSTGQVSQYTNPLGRTAPAITDTEAFARTSADNAPGNCSPSDTSYCLNDGRYKVEITWGDFQGQTGDARVADCVSDVSGAAWFFDAANVELIEKILKTCGANGSPWWFRALTTNVGVEGEAVHMPSGGRETYSNTLGQAAWTKTDTGSFPGACGFIAPFAFDKAKALYTPGSNTNSMQNLSHIPGANSVLNPENGLYQTGSLVLPETPRLLTPVSKASPQPYAVAMVPQ